MLTRISGQYENRRFDWGLEQASKGHAATRSFPILKFIIFALLYPTLSWAQILKHDVGSAKREFYSAKEVCEVMGLKHNLLVTTKPPASVDCMAREVLITDFCQKISKERMGLLRGKVDPYSKKVVCEYGQSLSLVFRCSPGSQDYCSSADKGCDRLRRVFAVGLKLEHSSILPDGADQRLQCYFSASKVAPAEQKIIPPLYLEE